MSVLSFVLCAGPKAKRDMITPLMTASKILMIANLGVAISDTLGGRRNSRELENLKSTWRAEEEVVAQDESAPDECVKFLVDVNQFIKNNDNYFQGVRKGNSIRRRFQQDVKTCAEPSDPFSTCSKTTASNAIQGMFDLVLQQKEGPCRTNAFSPTVQDQDMRMRFASNDFEIVKTCCPASDCERFNILRKVAEQAFETMTNSKECPARRGSAEPVGNVVPNSGVEASELSITENTCSQPYLMTRELVRFTVQRLSPSSPLQVNTAGVKEQLQCDTATVAPDAGDEPDSSDGDKGQLDDNIRNKIDLIKGKKLCKRVCYKSDDLCNRNKCKGCAFYDKKLDNCRRVSPP